MSLEINHIFIAVSEGAPEIEALKKKGFAEGPPNTHPGQGTACRRILFDNAYLEFLWVSDPSEVRRPEIQATGLAERADPTQGPCPFGLGLSFRGDTPPNVPFRTWSYRPPYLSGNDVIEMAENSRILEEPLIFILPHPYELNASRPEHPNGTKKVARISLTLPHAAFSDSFSKFRALGLVSVAQGPKPMLSLEFDTLGSAIHHDFQPLLPLELKW